MTTPDEEPRAGFFFPFLGACLAYAVATLAFTWPLAQHLDSWIVAGPRDGPMFLWNHWWGGHAAFELGVNPLRTDLLFAPEGTSLSLHTHALFPSLLTYPVRALFGTIVAFNVSLLLSIFLSAVGAWLLANEVVRDRRAAFLAGIAFAFCHLRTSTVMFHNLAQTHLLVFFCWTAWATFSRRSWGFAAATGLIGGAMLYASYTLSVLAAVWVALFALYALCARVRQGWRGLGRQALQFLVPVGILAVVALPLIQEMRAEIDKHGDYTSMRRQEDTREGRIEVRAVTESEVSPVHRYLVRGPMEGGRGESRLFLRRASYLGWAVLALAFLGLARFVCRPVVWWWLLLGAGFLVASLGQELDLTGLVEVDDSEPPMALPYAWLRDLPLLDSLRVSHRYGLIGALALSVLAAFGWKAALRFVPHKALAIGLTVMASTCVFFDFAQLPFPKMWEVPAPPPPLEEALKAIRDDPRDCCVLNYPAGRKGYSVFSYYDTLHEKPVYLDGQIARRIPALEKLQQQSDIRLALSSPFYGTMLNRAEQDRLRRKVRREVEENRIGWVIIAFEGSTRFESPPHNLTAPDLMERCKALTRVIRGSFPLDPDWTPTLTTGRWVSREGDMLRRPDSRIETWRQGSLKDRRSSTAILLVAKLRWDDEGSGR